MSIDTEKEREEFEVWLAKEWPTYKEEQAMRNIARSAWQARAALAQAQSSTDDWRHPSRDKSHEAKRRAYQIGYRDAQASGKAAPTIDRNAIIEECARVCEKEADDFQDRERFKYAECRSDAEQGCRACQYAILDLKNAPKNGVMAAGREG